VRARFLEVLANEAAGNVTLAAQGAGISRNQAYDWRHKDPDFAAAWEDALTLGLYRLEDRAIEMAMDGNDRLIMYLLSARLPDRYQPRTSIELNGRVSIGIDRQPMAQLRAELATLLGTTPPLTIDAEPAEETED